MPVASTMKNFKYTYRLYVHSENIKMHKTYKMLYQYVAQSSAWSFSELTKESEFNKNAEKSNKLNHINLLLFFALNSC